MITSYYSEFVSRQQVETSNEEFDCFAYETTDGKYYLAYQSKSDNNAYITDEPVLKDKLNFIGDKQVFVRPVTLKTHSEIVN